MQALACQIETTLRQRGDDVQPASLVSCLLHGAEDALGWLTYPLFVPLATQLLNLVHDDWEHRMYAPTTPPGLDGFLVDRVGHLAGCRPRVVEIVAELGRLDDDEAVHPRVVELFSLLGCRGVQQLLGFRTTVGTVDLLPPPPDELIRAFNSEHSPSNSSRVPSLSVGARALAKHAHRSSDGWWGQITGGNQLKNEMAETKIQYITNHATWVNVHVVVSESQAMEKRVVPILEVRVEEGYGARWEVHAEEPCVFRGFLEPHMSDGHATSWRH